MLGKKFGNLCWKRFEISLKKKEVKGGNELLQQLLKGKGKQGKGEGERETGKGNSERETVKVKG